MIINETRHAALIVLASCAASAAYTQTSRPQNGEFVRLDQPAVFDTNPNTGSLKCAERAAIGLAPKGEAERATRDGSAAPSLGRYVPIN